MMPTRIVFTLCLISLLLLSGCFNRDRQPVYAASEEVEPIQAPPGLDQPRTSGIYEVPGYSVPELAAQGEEAWPPQVQPSSVAEQSRAHIRFGPSGLYLAVEDEPASVTNRLLAELDREGMQLRNASEEDNRYVFRLDHEPIVPEKTGFSRLFFWQRPEVMDYSGNYVARVKPAEEPGETVIELLDEDGGVVDMERAEFVLARLRERLG